MTILGTVVPTIVPMVVGDTESLGVRSVGTVEVIDATTKA